MSDYVARISHHVSTIVGSLSSFLLLNKLLQVSTHPVQHLLKQTDTPEWQWRNIVCSLVHSSLSSYLCIHCHLDEPAFCQDMITPHSPSAARLVAISSGYFVYDLLDILRHSGLKQLDLVIHHGGILMPFLTALSTQRYHGYAVWALLMELNSVFLHARQILKMLGMHHTRLYKLTASMVLLTWLLFRFMAPSWMLVWTVRHLRELSPLARVITVLGMVVAIPTNISLIGKIWRSDVMSRAKVCTH